jgi:hypothetical protein
VLSETVREIINISAEKHQCYYELKEHKPILTKGAPNYQIKGNKPNCIGYRIQVK